MSQGIAQDMIQCFSNIENSIHRLLDFLQNINKIALLKIDQATIIHMTEALEKFIIPIYDFETNKNELRRKITADLLHLKISTINAPHVEVQRINFTPAHDFFGQIQTNILQLLKITQTIHPNVPIQHPALIQFQLRKLMAFESTFTSTQQFSQWTPQIVAQRFYPTYEKIVFLQQYQQRLRRF